MSRCLRIGDKGVDVKLNLCHYSYMNKPKLMEARKKRAAKMRKLYESGKTLRDIGALFPHNGKPISEQRVSWLIRNTQ